MRCKRVRRASNPKTEFAFTYYSNDIHYIISSKRETKSLFLRWNWQPRLQTNTIFCTNALWYEADQLKYFCLFKYKSPSRVRSLYCLQGFDSEMSFEMFLISRENKTTSKVSECCLKMHTIISITSKRNFFICLKKFVSMWSMYEGFIFYIASE